MGGCKSHELTSSYRAMHNKCSRSDARKNTVTHKNMLCYNQSCRAPALRKLNGGKHMKQDEVGEFESDGANRWAFARATDMASIY